MNGNETRMKETAIEALLLHQILANQPSKLLNLTISVLVKEKLRQRRTLVISSCLGNFDPVEVAFDLRNAASGGNRSEVGDENGGDQDKPAIDADPREERHGERILLRESKRGGR